SRCAASNEQTGNHSLLPTGQFHFHGAETPDLFHRHEYRRFFPEIPYSWPNTQCASRDDRLPRVIATKALRVSTPSTEQNPLDGVFCRQPQPVPPPASLPDFDRRVSDTPERFPRQSIRRLRRHTHDLWQPEFR